MARFLTLIFFLFLSVSLSFSQEDSSWEQKKQQFKADKIAFISTEMNFSVEDAQKFWPIYNKYDVIFDQIGEQRRKTFDPRIQDVNSLSSAECEIVLTTFLNLDEKELLAKKNFFNELKSTFPADFLMKYYHAEHEFRRRIFSDNKNRGASFGKSFKIN